MKKSLSFLSAVLLSAAVIYGCGLLNITGSHEPPVFMTWDTEGNIGSNKSDKEIAAYLAEMKEHNISGIFLVGSNEFYKRITPLANKTGIQIHAWRWTMNQPKQELMENHPDWYAVSKNNKSCVDKPPYVGYYRWLCPNNPEAIHYLIEMYKELAQIEGIAGIHFDYIRYCDIFLPVGLQPKYNLVQDHEMPEYDFCYCSRCRTGFAKEYGEDPMFITDSVMLEKWKKWRLNSIVNVANTITAEIKKVKDIHVTAAVFPTPQMAARMVRQDWGRFEMDAVCPMLYNQFYNEDINWIGECVRDGIETMEYKKDLYAGIMVNHVSEPDQFKAAIEIALDSGAKGIVFFNAVNMTAEQFEILKDFKN